MLQTPAGTYLAKLRWKLTGDPEEMISTIGVDIQEDEPHENGALGHAQEIAEDWAGAFPAGLLGSNWSFMGVSLWQQLEGAPAPTIAHYDVTINGTGSLSTLPVNCAILVKKRTALGGRHNQGRMFLPAGVVAENDVGQTGMIDSSTLTSRQNALNQFMTNLLNPEEHAGGTTSNRRYWPVILHNNPAILPSVITQLTVDTHIATQRRRLR